MLVWECHSEIHSSVANIRLILLHVQHLSLYKLISNMNGALRSTLGLRLHREFR